VSPNGEVPAAIVTTCDTRSVELIAGWLLVVGWRVRESLVALGLVLVIATYGHLLKEPLFSFSGHVIPRPALLVFVAMDPSDEDRPSLDWWLEHRTPTPAE
jgi:hypothetical protein